MNRLVLLSTAAVWVTLMPQMVSAQTADQSAEQSDNMATEAIIVTARRREEAISDVPISISAFSGDQLETKTVMSVADLTKITPGLNISGGGAKANPFITIRGQSRGVTGNVSPGVLTYFNDIPLATYGSLMQTYDMENIQVLKGPQGTLFGRNSIGGAILTYSKAPTHDFNGYVKGDVAGYSNKKFGGFRQIEGAINVPIIQDVLAVRASAQVFHDDGPSTTYVVSPYTLDPVTRVATVGTASRAKHDLDEYAGQSYRLSILFEPTDWIKNVTVGDYSKIRGTNNGQFDRFWPQGFSSPSLGTFPPGLVFLPPATIQANLTPSLGAAGAAAFAQNVQRLFQCGNNFLCDYRLYQNFGDHNKRTQYVTVDPWATRIIAKGVTNTTTINIGDDHTLKNIFGYREVSNYNLGDNENSPVPIIDTSSQIELKQISDELQLSGSLFDKRLTYTVGGFYYRESPNGPGGNQMLEISAFGGLSHSMNVTYLTNESKALYGQFDYSLDDFISGLTVTAGARETWDSTKGCAVGVTITPFATQPLVVRDANSDIIPTERECETGSISVPGATSFNAQVLPKVTFKKLTYTLGFNWKLARDVMVYAVKRRGYRGGNYNTPLVDSFFSGIQTFQPEVLDDYEVGTKLSWRAGQVRGTLNVAAFTGKDKGRQIQISTSNLNGGTCIPEAVGSDGRTSNCTTAARQVAYPVGTPGVNLRYPIATTIVNAGTITIRGFEVDGTITPVDGFTLGGGLSYVDSKVNSISFDPGLSALLRAANVGVPTTIVVEQQPKWSANGNVSINIPTKVLGGDLSLNTDIKYSDKFQLSTVFVKSYITVDSRITLADIGGSGIDVSIWGRNLLNEDYNYGTSASSPNANGAQSFIHANPRTIGLSVRYNFGR
ncbi:TonB-dependent receptor [Sphingobium sp.]|uniref:TonB-dependent receptor n=1 Tax=Sphingobium sp. TaxID=1912891 RepID=UPI002BD66EF2|nr:TonB-dependent receptor plug domain-containing protein [Sphingobium sp.]HUD94005.1 TonB-dependent receptor plug domain-containing protein [Sphingobium sp.]